MTAYIIAAVRSLVSSKSRRTLHTPASTAGGDFTPGVAVRTRTSGVRVDLTTSSTLKPMPPEEANDTTLKEQSVPPLPRVSPAKQHDDDSDIASIGPPDTGWIRSSELFRARNLSMADRHAVLRELSEDMRPGLGVGTKQQLSPFEEAFSMFLYFLFPGCMLWIPFALGGAVWAAYRYLSLPLQASLGGVLAVLFFWPLSHWPAVTQTWLTPLLFRYTSSSTAWEAPLEANGGPYLLVAPPHGVLPVGNIITMLSFPMLWGHSFKGLTTDAALRLPVMRHVMTWIGCQSAASKEAMRSVTDGWSLGLCPGGVAEIFDSNNDDEVLFLRARKGFVKLSLRMGTPMVPCYTFGNTRVFRSWHDPYGILRALSRKLGFGALLIWGRLLLPIILRQPLMCVTGRPIVVPKANGEPTQADIDKYHALFVAELRRIFDKYKGPYGWGDKELIIS